MRVVKCTRKHGYASVNFVDKNNVVLGFETGQCCCESAGWRFLTPARALEDDPESLGPPFDLEDFVFDPTYFEEGEDAKRLDSGGWAKFRLVDTHGREMFLELYNVHNGYYSHGFDFKVGDEVKQKGAV